MKIENLFKSLILAYIVIFVGYIILASTTDLNSSESYRLITEILDQEILIYEMMGVSDGLYLFFSLFVFIFYLYALYSLYRFKSYSRILYVISLIILYSYLLLNENSSFVTVFTTLDYYFDVITIFMESAILMFIFFTPIKDKIKT